MFAVESFIDTVQGTKKQFVSTFVTEEKLRKPLHAFVDAQTVFAKQMWKSFSDISLFVKDEASNVMQKVSAVKNT